MLTELLWYLESKMQYRRQRQQGLAGLVGILLVIFFVWKWEDWFYPIFDKLGLVALAERTGLVHDLSVVTVINVIAIIVLLCIFIGLILLSLLIVGILLLALGFSKFGEFLFGLAIFPFLLFQLIKLKRQSVEQVYKRDPELRKLLEQYFDLDVTERNFLLYLKQLEREDPSFSVEYEEGVNIIEKHLHKLTPNIKDHSYWRIVFTNKKYYLMFPNPLPALGSKIFEKDNVYMRKGPYVFDDLIIDYLVNTAFGKVNPSFHTLAIPIEIQWNGERFYLSVKTDEPFQTLSSGGRYATIYKISSKETDEIFTKLIEENNQLYRLLKNAHVAFYLIPMVYSDTDKDMKEVKEFLHQCVNMPNRKEYFENYKEDVINDIEFFADCGEEWAKELKKVVYQFG